MIQNESLERDLINCERELEMLKVARSCLVHVGLVRVMDKLLGHPKFTGGISRICHEALVTGEESLRASLKAQVDAGTYDPAASIIII